MSISKYKIMFLKSWNFAKANVLAMPVKKFCKVNLSKVGSQVGVKGSENMNAEIFGDFCEDSSILAQTKEDLEDIQENKRKKKMDRRGPGVYIDIIKAHLNDHQYMKAVNVLEERMMKIDRVKPDSYIYDLLISYCGRKGDVKEAFRLYNQIKNRGYPVTGGQYTSLFNACANSHRSQLALEVAGKVRSYLAADDVHKINIKNYNVMLKAFGRHGDLKTALSIVDEVLERRGKVQADTYNFLLQACISDPNSGFRHALFTWHRMLQHKTDPSVFTFNLLLRATRDCNLGDPSQIQNLLDEIVREAPSRFLRKLTVTSAAQMLPPIDSIQKQQFSAQDPNTNCRETRFEDQRQLHSTGTEKMPIAEERHSAQGEIEDQYVESPGENVIEKVNNEVSFVSLRQELSVDLPNMIAIRPKIGSFTRLATFKSAYHRLLLMGGVTGFLQVMDSIQIKPDIKTFTLLLEIIPSTEEAEKDLMSIMKLKRLPFDTGFFNVLIKKRCFRNDYKAAKEVLGLMQMAGVQLDLVTFGVLSLTCQTREDAEEFIGSVREAGFRLNSEMLTPMVRRATYIADLKMGLLLLRAIKEDDVQPNPRLMSHIHKFVETHKGREAAKSQQ